MSRSQSKYWCFTINNPTEDDESLCRGLFGSNAQYLVFGREEGEEKQTRHLQGYVEFVNRKRLSALKKFHATAHWERRKGTKIEAIQYCKKDGDWEEVGETKGERGTRSDLEAIRKEIDRGISNEKIAESYFGSWCRYRKSFEEYRMLRNSKQIRLDLRVFVLHGDAGTGKTRFVYEEERELFICPDPTLKWFDGYAGESAVLIDDFRGGADFAFLLRLLDIYPLRVPIKGSFVSWGPKRIWITSNLPPEAWYTDLTAQSYAALKRRIHRVVHCSGFVGNDWSSFRAGLESQFGLGGSVGGVLNGSIDAGTVSGTESEFEVKEGFEDEWSDEV